MRFVRGFIFGLSYLPVALFAIVVIAYIVKTWLVVGNERVGFDMAGISALIGGFSLTGALVDRAQDNLRRVGLTYLVSTIAFVVLGISAPILDDFCFMPYLGAVSIAVGSLFFAMGTARLVMEIPRLWNAR